MVFIGRVLYHLMVCTIKLHFSLYEIMKKEDISRLSQSVSLKPRLLNVAGNLWNCQVFASNIYVICKGIAVIKICKIAEEGGGGEGASELTSYSIYWAQR